ncbi:MAG: homocysteine S-methyltransferase family protein [Coriobacteriia bacterium]|nr:homocysteine S-methyltransferase family protein [Coriobacteriia bacterium]
MADIALRFERDIVVLDGAMGSLLMAEGIDTETHPMHVNVLDPELIESIHKRYLLAGAQAITTNSFSGSKVSLAAYGLEAQADELNRAAVRIARSCRPQHILADVGPCGLLLPPYGSAAFDAVFAIYAEQIASLASEEPDAILIETMIDIADARLALLAAKSVTDLPVFVSVSFDEHGLMPLSATSAAAAALILEAAGADVIGINCSLGPAAMLSLTSQMAAVTALPLLAQPNSGLPLVDRSGQVTYSGTPDQMAEAAWAFRQLGVQFIGSCCGSDPAHTAAIFATVGDTDVAISGRKQRLGMALASPRSLVEIALDKPCISVGELLGVADAERIASEFRSGAFASASDACIDLNETGIDLLSVNLDAEGVTSVAGSAIQYAALISELVSVSRAPLILGCQDMTALEAALRVYPGKAMIGPFCASDENLQPFLSLASHYGAAVIVFCDNETPAQAEQVLLVADIVSLKKTDILFDIQSANAGGVDDALAQTISTVKAFKSRDLLTFASATRHSSDHAAFGSDDYSRLQIDFVKATIAAGINAVTFDTKDEQVAAAFQAANELRELNRLSRIGSGALA